MQIYDKFILIITQHDQISKFHSTPQNLDITKTHPWMENIIMKKKKNSKGLQSIHSPTNVPKPDFSSDHKNVTKLKKRDPEKIENLPHTVQ